MPSFSKGSEISEHHLISFSFIEYHKSVPPAVPRGMSKIALKGGGYLGGSLIRTIDKQSSGN